MFLYILKFLYFILYLFIDINMYYNILQYIYNIISTTKKASDNKDIINNKFYKISYSRGIECFEN